VITDAAASLDGADVMEFLSHPADLFGNSKTEMHSVGRPVMNRLQAEALAVRFRQHAEQIAMVAKLAGRQGINKIEAVEDVVPLLFDHTMYKSYPLALLERQQFDRLNTWLSKLTAVDISGLDLGGCHSIDDWLDLLERETGLDVTYTSGTSGTMSFLPWSKRDYTEGWRVNRVNALQRYGEPASREAVAEPYHFIVRANKLRGSYRTDTMTFGDPRYEHTCLGRPSADLTWLAARIRHAAARGDVSNVQVPAALLARRGELEQARVDDEAAVTKWLEDIKALQGQRIIWTNYPYDIYSIAAPRVTDGVHWTFAPGSVLVIGGGAKGNNLPASWAETVAQFTDARIVKSYGMQEISNLQLMCEAGRYHLQPWVIPFILDPDTSALLPRSGVQVGRLGVFDLLAESHWGGVLSGDEVEVDFDSPCECGATTLHVGPDIARLSDKRGGDDKITCTASPQAYDEAMQFLSGY
jgi:GH25 family lysozyme M1 (1,4-beta-N-acetylmuramidase)